MSTWELGKKIPRMGPVEKMAKYFGISKSAILDDAAEALALTPEEVELIKNYRKASQRDKRIARALLKDD